LDGFLLDRRFCGPVFTYMDIDQKQETSKMVSMDIRDFRIHQRHHFNHRYFEARRRDSVPFDTDNYRHLVDLLEGFKTEQGFQEELDFFLLVFTVKEKFRAKLAAESNSACQIGAFLTKMLVTDRAFFQVIKIDFLIAYIATIFIQSHSFPVLLLFISESSPLIFFYNISLILIQWLS
jgi:hypothetical protein